MSSEIIVNGEKRSVPAGQTLAELVRELDLEGRRVAVEVNEEIVPRSQYSEHVLNGGDRVEVVAAIGGG
jgi:sulfur carrier protein